MKSLAMALLPEVTLCAEANVDVKRAGRALGIVWLLRCPPHSRRELGEREGHGVMARAAVLDGCTRRRAVTMTVSPSAVETQGLLLAQVGAKPVRHSCGSHLLLHRLRSGWGQGCSFDSASLPIPNNPELNSRLNFSWAHVLLLPAPEPLGKGSLGSPEQLGVSAYLPILDFSLVSTSSASPLQPPNLHLCSGL